VLGILSSALLGFILAKNIDSGGCSYSNGSKSVEVSWASFPHFYKKGSLIVLYAGEDGNVMSDLEEIFGEQFAGYKPRLSHAASARCLGNHRQIVTCLHIQNCCKGGYHDTYIK
jgi:hypothetical protein